MLKTMSTSVNLLRTSTCEQRTGNQNRDPMLRVASQHCDCAKVALRLIASALRCQCSDATRSVPELINELCYAACLSLIGLAS